MRHLNIYLHSADMAEWTQSTRRPPLTRAAIDLVERSFRIESPIELGDVQGVLLPLELCVVQRSGVPQLPVSASGPAHPALRPVGLGVWMVGVRVGVLQMVVTLLLLVVVLIHLIAVVVVQLLRVAT